MKQLSLVVILHFFQAYIMPHNALTVLAVITANILVKQMKLDHVNKAISAKQDQKAKLLLYV
jgi:hypothetical protein